MSSLDQRVVVYQLAVKNRARAIKQTQCHFHPKLISYIETEVNKLIQAGFIHEVKYPTWISNIMPVKKGMAKFIFAWIFETLIMLVPKMTFHFQSPRSWLKLP